MAKRRKRAAARAVKNQVLNIKRGLTSLGSEVRPLSCLNYCSYFAMSLSAISANKIAVGVSALYTEGEKSGSEI